MELKNILLFFLLSLLVLSNQFKNTILSNMDKTVENGEITQYGDVVRSICIVFGYICIEKLIDMDLL